MKQYVRELGEEASADIEGMRHSKIDKSREIFTFQ